MEDAGADNSTAPEKDIRQQDHTANQPEGIEESNTEKEPVVRAEQEVVAPENEDTGNETAGTPETTAEIETEDTTEHGKEERHPKPKPTMHSLPWTS
ncbi:MAG: hypothetical protein HC896_16415 [Bacteroidales bacterium]|nr:hypothetical protein [Bacteroidales bacterium]